MCWLNLQSFFIFLFIDIFSSGSEGAGLVGFEWAGLVQLLVQQVHRQTDLRHGPTNTYNETYGETFKRQPNNIQDLTY